jgi:16S rRNA (uracil1498-N3)-methyltransferase
VSRYDFTSQRLFLRAPLQAGAELELERDQANYLLNVLRLRDGAELLVFNGRDGEWRAKLEQSGRKSASLTAIAQQREQTPAGTIDYLFAPIKHARLDYMVQKAVEMGAASLRPVLTHRTQAQRVNTERMEANVIEAAEQCGILTIAPVHEPVTLDKALSDLDPMQHVIFCDEDAPAGDPVVQLRAALPKGARVAVLIGPEGGFDQQEREMLLRRNHCIAITLGPRILRADTAAIAALTIVQNAIGDLCD